MGWGGCSLCVCTDALSVCTDALSVCTDGLWVRTNALGVYTDALGVCTDALDVYTDALWVCTNVLCVYRACTSRGRCGGGVGAGRGRGRPHSRCRRSPPGKNAFVPLTSHARTHENKRRSGHVSAGNRRAAFAQKNSVRAEKQRSCRKTAFMQPHEKGRPPWAQTFPEHATKSSPGPRA
jgi:hypothetical protein